MRNIAEVRVFCGRHYLSVAGYAVAMEGDPCRDIKIVMDEGVSISDAFGRKDTWNESRLTRLANEINNYVEEQKSKIIEREEAFEKIIHPKTEYTKG